MLFAKIPSLLEVFDRPISTLAGMRRVAANVIDTVPLKVLQHLRRLGLRCVPTYILRGLCRGCSAAREARSSATVPAPAASAVVVPASDKNCLRFMSQVSLGVCAGIGTELVSISNHLLRDSAVKPNNHSRD